MAVAYVCMDRMPMSASVSQDGEDNTVNFLQRTAQGIAVETMPLVSIGR